MSVRLVINALILQLCVFQLLTQIINLGLQLIDDLLRRSILLLLYAPFFSLLLQLKLYFLNFKLQIDYLLLVEAVILKFGNLVF